MNLGSVGEVELSEPKQKSKAGNVRRLEINLQGELIWHAQPETQSNGAYHERNN
jgi:hypothetical protein